MFGKIFASLYQGTLRGQAHELLVFTNMIAHADAYGRVDKHFKAIADEVGLTVDEVKQACANLEAPDPESRSPELDGRRIIPVDEHRAWGWQIVNYAKYRAIKNEEDRRIKNAEYQAKWRAKQKQEREQESAGVSTGRGGVRQSKGESAQEEGEAFVHSLKGAGTAPTQDEVKAYADMRGITPDCAEQYWLSRDRVGWEYKGQTITKWQPDLQAFWNSWRENKHRQQAQGNGINRRTGQPNRSAGTANEGKASQYRNVGKLTG